MVRSLLSEGCLSVHFKVIFFFSSSVQICKDPLVAELRSCTCGELAAAVACRSWRDSGWLTYLDRSSFFFLHKSSPALISRDVSTLTWTTTKIKQWFMCKSEQHMVIGLGEQWQQRQRNVCHTTLSTSPRGRMILTIFRMDCKVCWFTTILTAPEEAWLLKISRKKKHWTTNCTKTIWPEFSCDTCIVQIWLLSFQHGGLLPWAWLTIHAGSQRKLFLTHDVGVNIEKEPKFVPIW